MIDAVALDLGGVVVDWDPRHLYRKLLPDEHAVEEFLATICTQAWNVQQDRGRPLAEATKLLVERHPEHEELIRAYYGRWTEMLRGEIPGMPELVDELRAASVRVYALSNWSAETFPLALDSCPVLRRFDGILISGDVGCAKPDREIFERFCHRFSTEPARTLFVDDHERNVAAARDAGFPAELFQSVGQVRGLLSAHGLLSAEC